MVADIASHDTVQRTLGRRRVAVVTGHDCDYNRLKPVLRAIDRHPTLEYVLVAIGSHLLERYGSTQNKIINDGYTVHKQIYTIIEGETPTTMAKSTGLGIIELASFFENARPDIVLILGEHFEVYSAAVAAAMMNIPLAHIRGGDVSGTIDESLRHSITKLAHIHFPATELARERIIKMGERPESVFSVGCPSIDVLLETPLLSPTEVFASPEITHDKNPSDHLPLDPHKPFLLVIQHPVTTEYERNYQNIQETLAAVRRTEMQALMLWPNPDAGSELIVKGVRHYLLKHPMPQVYFYKRFTTEIFINLLRHTACFIGNSSACITESCYFGVPTVNIGSRQEGRERPQNVVDAGYSHEEIYTAIARQVAHGAYLPAYPFGDGHAAERIVDVLANFDISKVQKRLAY